MLLAMQWLHSPLHHLVEHASHQHSHNVEATHSHIHGCGHSHQHHSDEVDHTDSDPLSHHKHEDCQLCEHLAKSLATVTVEQPTITNEPVFTCDVFPSLEYRSPILLSGFARGPPVTA